MSFEMLKVTSEQGGRVLLLEFDHGKANEVGTRVLRDLEALATHIESSTDVVALISYSRRLSSRGTPIFVAGANVTERQGWDDQQVKQHVAWQRQVLGRIRRAPVFHVGVVAGVALGWGTEYLLCCDYRIAAPGAVFGLPETGLGIVPGAGGSSDLWAHIGVAQTLRLGMTCERINPVEAERIGLVQEVATNIDDALERARKLTSLAAKRSPTAMAAFKHAVLASVGADPEDRAAFEAVAYEHCVNTGEAAVGREHFAEIQAGKVPPWSSRIPWGGGEDAAS